jgi:hypothetical protein
MSSPSLGCSRIRVRASGEGGVHACMHVRRRTTTVLQWRHWCLASQAGALTNERSNEVDDSDASAHAISSRTAVLLFGGRPCSDAVSKFGGEDAGFLVPSLAEEIFEALVRVGRATAVEWDSTERVWIAVRLGCRQRDRRRSRVAPYCCEIVFVGMTSTTRPCVAAACVRSNTSPRMAM